METTTDARAPSAMTTTPGPRARGPGGGRVVARSFAGRTAITTSRAEPPLRLIRPTFPGTTTSAAICAVTFGGGLVDGDAIALDLEVEAGATLLLFTQSSTKVFRGAARQQIDARVDGTLVLLPDPVAAFAGASYTQRVDVELGASGSCVLLDGFTAGRAAFGERWAMDRLDLRTTVRRDGQPVLVDALRLDAEDGPIAPRTTRYDAFLTLAAIGHAAQPVISAIRADRIAPPNGERAIAVTAPLPSLPSPGSGDTPSAIGRVAAARTSIALDVVRSWLRNLPEMDVVDPFASRY